jgi:hypothetical protein
MRFECVYLKEKTWNTRKTKEVDHVCVDTVIQSKDYPFKLYISQQKRLSGQWGIESTCLYHNHLPNPDPFQYIQHRSRRLGHVEALAAAATYSRAIGYAASAAILCKDSIEIDCKTYNNLRRQASSRKDLLRQLELELLLRDLEREGLHPRVRDEYIIDEHGH